MSFIWMNGFLRTSEETRVSPLDHGVITGDGLFETIISYSGEPFALKRHVARLKASAQGMFMDTAAIDQVPWREAIIEVLQANKLTDARIRVTYTTGDADLGSDRGKSPPMVMIAAGAFSTSNAEGKLSLVPWPRNEKGALSGLKTISYGENVKALFFAKKNGANEALFLNTQGHVCEGTGSNVAWIKQGKLFTPKLETGCLAGITRALMLELAQKNSIPVEEVQAPLSELLAADEVILTSTLREVQWVSSVDDKKWDPSSNKVAKKLKELFVDYSRKNIDP
ncbi:MAG: aminodeoxychorismate lyase [Bdellovibrionota bacterium]